MKYYVSGIPACVSSFQHKLKVLRCWKPVLTCCLCGNILLCLQGLLRHLCFLKVLMSYVHLAIPTAICFPGEKGRGVLHLQQSGMCANHIPALAAEQDLLVIGRLILLYSIVLNLFSEFYLFMKTLAPGLTSWNSCSQWLGCYPLLNGTPPTGNSVRGNKCHSVLFWH